MKLIKIYFIMFIPVVFIIGCVLKDKENFATNESIFLEYGDFGQEYAIKVFKNGSFDGWKWFDEIALENKGIHLEGILPYNRLDDLEAIMVKYNFQKFKNFKGEDISMDDCGPGFNLSINFDNIKRNFVVYCTCPSTETCKFFGEVESFLVSVINEKINESACEQVGNKFKDKCYAQFAINKSENSLCEKINQSSIRNNCYIKIGIKIINFSLCEKLSAGAQFDCIRKIANELYRIENPNERRKMCDLLSNRTYDKISFTFGRYSFTNTSNKELCYFYLIDTIKDPILCESLSVMNRINCLADLAPEMIDEDEFDVIEKTCNLKGGGNIYSAESCIFVEIVNLKNPKLCDRTHDRDGCLLVIAFDTSNINICDKISEISQRDNCYDQIAVRNKNLEYCEKIANIKTKESCKKIIRKYS